MPPVAPTTVLFPAVQAVLKKIIADYTVGNGGAPDLSVHGASFSWDTRDALCAASAFGNPLIQSNIIGQIGLGKTANLVIDLTTGLSGFPRMPLGGLDSSNNTYLDPNSPEIQTIVDWIEGGCKDVGDAVA
jgi:hypothetical protein